MSLAPLLILCLVMTLLIGQPLLPGSDSRVPDIITFGILPASSR